MSDDRKPAKLKNLRVTRVDLVDRGANPDADIVLFKRRDGPGAPALVNKKEGEPVSDNWLRRVVMGIAKKVGLSDGDLTKMAPMMPDEVMEQEKAMQEFWDAKWALSRSIDSIMECDEPMDKKMELVGQAVSQFAQHCQTMMPKMQMGEEMCKEFLAELTTAGSDVAKVQSVVKALVPPAAPGNTLVNPPSVNKKEGEDPVFKTLEEFLKSLSPEDRTAAESEITKRAPAPVVTVPESVAKRLDELEKSAAKVIDLEKRATDAETKLAKSETDLAAEREQRTAREYLTKGAHYPTSGTPEQVSAKLRKAYGVSPEFGAEIEADLAKAEGLAKASKLFESAGKSGTAPIGSADDQIQKRAEEKVAKGLATTLEQATDIVLRENPGLYAQSLTEKGGH